MKQMIEHVIEWKLDIRRTSYCVGLLHMHVRARWTVPTIL